MINLKFYFCLSEVILLHFHVLAILQLKAHFDQSKESLSQLVLNFSFFFQAVFHLFNLLLTDVLLLSFGHALILAVGLMLVAIAYLYIRFAQNVQLLMKGLNSLEKSSKNVQISNYLLHKVATNDVRSLELLFTVAPSISAIFFAFTLVNGPANACLTMLLLLEGDHNGHHVPPMSTTTFLYGAAFALHQFVCILAIHLLYARFTRAVHALARPLLRLTPVMPPGGSPSQTRSNFKTSNHSNFRFREQLLVAGMVARLHTSSRHRYGIHYGPFSLVTMAAFVKFALLYLEMLMYSYKLINRF